MCCIPQIITAKCDILWYNIIVLIINTINLKHNLDEYVNGLFKSNQFYLKKGDIVFYINMTCFLTQDLINAAYIVLLLHIHLSNPCPDLVNCCVEADLSEICLSIRILPIKDSCVQKTAV